MTHLSEQLKTVQEALESHAIGTGVCKALSFLPAIIEGVRGMEAGAHDFYDDVYEQCQDLIEPHIVHMPQGSACGPRSLCASVVESLGFLVEFWVKHRTPQHVPQVSVEVVERAARAIHNACAELDKPYPTAIPCYSMNRNEDGWRLMAKAALAAIQHPEGEK